MRTQFSQITVAFFPSKSTLRASTCIDSVKASSHKEVKHLAGLRVHPLESFVTEVMLRVQPGPLADRWELLAQQEKTEQPRFCARTMRRNCLLLWGQLMKIKTKFTRDKANQKCICLPAGVAQWLSVHL